MGQAKTLREIIDYAIAKERVACALYSDAAREARLPGPKRMLKELSQTEAEHAKQLKALDLTNIPDAMPEDIEDLRIAEFLKDVDLGPDADLQTILIYAIKREQASRDFYEAMAQKYDDPAAAKLFTALAAQEKEHKKTLETVYDEEILREN